MSVPLSKTNCLIHPARPASARCPVCKSFYCAECITEHEGRLTCARCLAAEGVTDTVRKKRLRIPVLAFLQLALGLVVAWMLFYAAARVLLSIPAEFHDGTLWEE